MGEKHLRQLQVNTVGFPVANTCRGQGVFVTSPGKQEPQSPEACWFFMVCPILETHFLHKTDKVKIGGGLELLLQRMTYRTYLVIWTR